MHCYNDWAFFDYTKELQRVLHVGTMPATLTHIHISSLKDSLNNAFVKKWKKKRNVAKKLGFENS